MAEKVVLPRCLGIPVLYDPALPILSDSRGIGAWKKITVGPSFLELTERQKGAVLLHEAGHCKLWHTEKLIAYTLRHPHLLAALIAASIAAARRFKKDSPAARVWFQQELERRAPGIAAYRQAQERQADTYAANCGYGADLAQVFARMGDAGGGFHPDVESRIRHVTGESHG